MIINILFITMRLKLVVSFLVLKKLKMKRQNVVFLVVFKNAAQHFLEHSQLFYLGDPGPCTVSYLCPGPSTIIILSR